MKSVFDYEDYKIYLNDWILAQPRKGRGLKSSFAEVARCQTAFISQVLNDQAHFNLEQAQAVSAYMSHTSDEFHFFMLLLQLARAGSRKLKEYFFSQVKSIREQRLMIKNRVKAKQTLSAEDRAIYYSHWLYGAIHVAVTIPHLKSREKLAQYFHFPVSKITHIVDFLVAAGLLKINDVGVLEIGEARIHLTGDSPLISKHHTNWRMKAIQSLEKENSNELHYSSVATISKSDVRRIKDLLIDSIERANAIINPSVEEELWCICLDMFEL